MYMTEIVAFQGVQIVPLFSPASFCILYEAAYSLCSQRERNSEHLGLI